MYVIQNHAFTLIKADFEVPFLPGYGLALLAELADSEAGSFRLDNIQRLEVSSQGVSFWDIFVWWLDLVRRCLFNGSICAGRKKIDSGDFHRLGRNDRGNRDGHGVVIAVCFGGIVWISNIKEALEHALVVSEETFVDTVGSWRS